MSDPSTSPPPGSIPTLDVPKLRGVRRVHMIGIGGAGMRNLAKLLLARGDRGQRVGPEGLEGARGSSRPLVRSCAVGHDGARIGDPDAVVISSAIRATNPELVAARDAAHPRLGASAGCSPPRERGCR